MSKQRIDCKVDDKGTITLCSFVDDELVSVTKYVPGKITWPTKGDDNE